MVSSAKEAAEYKLYEGAVQQRIALQEIHSFLHSVTDITGFSITPRIFPSHFPHFFISGTRSLEVSMSWTLTTRSQRCFRQINAPYRTVVQKGTTAKCNHKTLLLCQHTQELMTSLNLMLSAGNDAAINTCA